VKGAGEPSRERCFGAGTRQAQCIKTQLVDKLVEKDECADVRTITVGAFEAKTHLSQLLTEVEKGAEVRITRRGRLVAVMTSGSTPEPHAIRSVLERLAGHRSDVEIAELMAYRDEGRKR
jgi:prevent-host-death family protein